MNFFNRLSRRWASLKLQCLMLIDEDRRGALPDAPQRYLVGYDRRDQKKTRS